MIRLVLLLCGGLYVAAMVLGVDHGQKRHGLTPADSAPAALVEADVTNQKAVFVPAQPVMQAATVAPDLSSPDLLVPEPLAPETVAPATVAEAPTSTQTEFQTEVLNTAPEPLPAPEVSGGLLYTVAAVQANVRGGPGRTFAVLDSLHRGEQVLVILEDQPLEGWTRVRIEGDGVEGYVSTRLLTPSR